MEVIILLVGAGLIAGFFGILVYFTDRPVRHHTV